MRITDLLLAIALAILSARPINAQTPAWEDRAFININLGRHLTSSPFVETLAPVIYDERGTLSSTHTIDSGLIKIDLAGGVRLAGHLGVGAGYTVFNATEVGSVSALVPHPLRYNQPRSATAPAEFTHSETALHLQAVWMIPITERLDIAITGGPSVVTVKQDLVSGIMIEETSPTFATVGIAKVNLVNQSATGLAFNAGVDVTYFLTPLVGVGLTLRQVGGSIDLAAPGGGTVKLDVGGFQYGFGARVRLR